MKYDIILVPFPFDDLSANKLRPAICLTDSITPHNHVIIAFITSQVAKATESSDIIIANTDFDFPLTGLKISSAIRLHRLVTVDIAIITRRLGQLPSSFEIQLKQKITHLFDL
jgi:mRNA interferase MazF